MAQYSRDAQVDRDRGEIDLGAAVALVTDGWRMVAAVTALVFGACLVYIVAAVPQYRTDALVQVEPRESGLSGIEELSSMITGETPTAAEIEIIRSRLVLTEAIDREGLQVLIEPRVFPLVGGLLRRRYQGEGPAAAPFGLDSFAWGGERLRVDRLDVSRDLESQPLRLVAGSNGQYTLDGPDGDRLLSGTVGVAAEGAGVEAFVSELEARPGTVFHVTKFHILEALDALAGRLIVNERGSQSGVIQMSLTGPDPDGIASTLNAIASIYLRQNVERRSAEAAQTLTFLNQQLPVLKGQLDDAEEALNAYRVAQGSVDLDLETQGLLEQLTEIERQLSELELQWLERGERFTPEHPVMRGIAGQRSELEQSRARIEQQIRDLPDAAQEALGLMRDVRVADELYLLLLNRAQELRVVQAGTVGNARIIDTALVPRDPVSPVVLLTLALGLVSGVVLGVFAVFLWNAIDHSIRDPKLLEQHFGLPVYAIIPHNAMEQRASRQRSLKPGLIAIDDPQDAAVEGLRSLRTSIEFLFHESSSRVVTIGSASPACGKSFITANLGVLLAQLGRRVLLVDADLRRGHLHRRFDSPREPGLSELVAGVAEADTVIQATGQENLFVLSGGQIPSNPAEIIVSSRFRELLADFAQRFDIVLLDAPPILAASEAVTLAGLAGITLLVVRAGTGNKRETELAIDRLDQAGAGARGFVFNDLIAGSRSYAYTGYRYYRYSSK